jgi:tetratricopeptide (TPR) repeat protein
MDERMIPNQWERCLALLAAGVDALQQGNQALVEKAFAAVLVVAQALSPEQARDVRSLALCDLSRLRSKQGRDEEAQRIREQAISGLAGAADTTQDGLFQYMMVAALMDMGEFRRAIPFCEQSIQLEIARDEPGAMGEALRRAGQCYLRVGLRDHAAVTLREALKSFRHQHGDPRLPDVLMNMGHALRKSSPVDAERYYQEAADWHTARAQLESATPAWVNLGIICSEQGRHAESLAHYERALQVRERSPSTPPERMGTLLNNIANCYRRMGKFAEALQSVDRAIALLAPVGGSSLASAYGTRGLIFRDDGRDSEAVEWLKKANAEHEKQPSPNLETVAEDLENQVAALNRLGRPEEAKVTEERLASVRAAMTAIPTVDRDLTNLKPATKTAVLIELAFGRRPGMTTGKGEVIQLAGRLSEAVEAEAAGWYAGEVVGPESTTLIMYGPDAERLFALVEPILLSETICQRARVTIRRSEGYRELFLPGPVM